MTKLVNLIKFFLLIIVSIFISITIAHAKKISKKNAQYTGKALVEYETMFNAGSWYMIINKCEGIMLTTQHLGNIRDPLFIF